MNRRYFFRKLLLFSGAAVMPPYLFARKLYTPAAKSKVVQITHPHLVPDSGQISGMLDAGICRLFNCDNAVEGWKGVVKPGQTIGLKVNCLSGYGSTHTVLTEVIVEHLKIAGIKNNQIIIWDRLSKDLESAGYRIQDNKNKVRVMGNDILGFYGDLQVFGSAASLVCNTVVRECDVIINLPLLKDHSIAGLTMSLKNMFGAIHNPNKYHLNTGTPYIADVNMLPLIKNKVKLHIADAIEAQYEGGPSFMPHWRWPMNSLLFSRDPVALDYQGWQIIDAKRKETGLKSLKDSGREPTYIHTAADENHRLGTNHPDKIEFIKSIV